MEKSGLPKPEEFDRISYLDPATGSKTVCQNILAGSHVYEMTFDPDGYLWFAATGVHRIGRLDPNSCATAARYSAAGALPSNFYPQRISVGSNGYIYFTSGQLEELGRAYFSGESVNVHVFGYPRLMATLTTSSPALMAIYG